MLLSATSLIGNSVRNHDNEDLGKVEDMMMNTQSGETSYAVLSFGGFLGMGDKLFAVPYKALTLDTENHCFVLNESKERLKNAPGFDKDDWPDASDVRWQSEFKTFYNV